MLIERDLVRLIMQMNPYVSNEQKQIGPSMDFARRPAQALANVARAAKGAEAAKAAVAAAAKATEDALVAADKVPVDFSTFDFEMQDDPGYRLDWTWMFKGQGRIIRRAVRVTYNYPARDESGATPTEYLLIGYEGGSGP